jgi:uncharacterized protein (DUF3820 family)
MDDNSIMPFGKFKGEKMANVPSIYLLWCYEQEWCRGEVKKYIAANLDAIKSEIDYQNKKGK